MHLYIIPRGIKFHYDKFIEGLANTYLPYKYPDKNGVLGDVCVQINIKPLQVYEVVFPEECKDVVLNTILQGNDGIADGSQKYRHYINMIRKILRLDPIPEYKKDRMFPLYHENVEVTGIGLKKDCWIDCRDGKKYDKKENEFCFEGL